MAYSKAYYAANAERIRAKARVYGAARHAKNPQLGRDAFARWNAAHPELRKLMNRARNCVRRALANGTLARPVNCEECGRSGVQIQAAHRDYRSPLDVRWLCPSCHRKWDYWEPKRSTLEDGLPRLRYGEEHPNHKLTTEAVAEIRRLNADGFTTTQLAKRFGVSRYAVYSVLKGLTWREDSILRLDR